MSEVGNIEVRIHVDTSGVRTGVETAQRSLAGLSTHTQNMSGNMNRSFSLVNVAVVALGNAIANMASRAIGSIGQMTSSAVRNFSQLESATLGLRSIVTAQGKDFNEAEGFIKRYVSDGLIPLTDATAAFKQLSSAGYNIAQTERIMLRLKDASAFGRQASLTMGEAVRSAAEGIKNENSILVDNSGITKNLSVMWADYARSIGVGVRSLTAHQKLLATEKGIMQESNFQLGDAARYSAVLGGQLSLLSFKVKEMSVAFGSALAPALQKIIPYIVSFIEGVTNAFNRISKFMNLLFGTTTAQLSSIKTTIAATTAQAELGEALENTAEKAKKGVAGFDEVNQLQESMANSASNVASGLDNTAVPSSGTIAEPTIALPEGITGFAKTLKEILIPPLTEIKTLLGDVWKLIEPYLTSISRTILDDLKISAKNLKDTLTPLSDAVRFFVKCIDDLVRGDYDSLIKDLDLAFKNVHDTLLNGLTLIAPRIGGALKALEQSISKNWEEYKKSHPDDYNLGGWIVSLWNNSALGTWINNAWGNFVTVLKNLWTNFKSSFSADSDNSIFNLGKWVKYLWESSSLTTWISTAWNGFVNVLKNLWTNFKNLFSADSGNSIFNLANWIKYLWNTSSIGKWINTAWDSLVDTLKNIWANFKTSFSDLFNIAAWFKTMWENNGKPFLNVIIADVNSLIQKLNSFKINIPAVSIPGTDITVGGGSLGFNIPEIPKLATGGIVDSPTIAMIGEAGKEAVVPLENTAFVDTLASALGSAVLNAMQFNNSGSTQKTSSPEAVIKLDGTTLARTILPYLNKEQARIGNYAILQTT